jgi:hypothetical protein
MQRWGSHTKKAVAPAPKIQTQADMSRDCVVLSGFGCSRFDVVDVRDAEAEIGATPDGCVDDGGEVVGRKFAEVSRSRCIAIGGREWQVGRCARTTQNFEPAQLLDPQLHTFSTTPPHHRQHL